MANARNTAALKRFVDTLRVPGLGIVRLGKLYDAGITDSLQLIRVTSQQLGGALGDAAGRKAFEALQDSLEDASLPQLMVASGLFGRLTMEQAEWVVDAVPDLAMRDVDRQLVVYLYDEGASDDLVAAVVDRHDEFADWMQATGLVARFSGYHNDQPVRELVEAALARQAGAQVAAGPVFVEDDYDEDEDSDYDPDDDEADSDGPDEDLVPMRHLELMQQDLQLIRELFEELGDDDQDPRVQQEADEYEQQMDQRDVDLALFRCNPEQRAEAEFLYLLGEQDFIEEIPWMVEHYLEEDSELPRLAKADEDKMRQVASLVERRLGVIGEALDNLEDYMERYGTGELEQGVPCRQDRRLPHPFPLVEQPARHRPAPPARVAPLDLGRRDDDADEPELPDRLSGTRIAFVGHPPHERDAALKAGASLMPGPINAQLVVAAYRSPDNPDIAKAVERGTPVLTLEQFWERYGVEARASQHNQFSATEYSQRHQPKPLPQSLEGCRVVFGGSAHDEKALVTALRGKTTSHLTGDTALFVVSDDSYAKNKLFEAVFAHIPVVTKERFNELYRRPVARPLEGVRVYVYDHWSNAEVRAMIKLAGGRLVPGGEAYNLDDGRFQLPPDLGLVVVPDVLDPVEDGDVRRGAVDAGAPLMTESDFLVWISELLQSAGDNPQPVALRQAQQLPLGQMTISFAGRAGLKEAKELARREGAAVVPQVTPQLDLLVTQDGMAESNKTETAREWNVPVVSAAEFLASYGSREPLQPRRAQQQVAQRQAPVGLQGAAIAFAGLRGLQLAELKNWAADRGAQISTTVSRATNLLVATPESGNSSKATKAARLELPVLSPEEFQARYA